MRRRRVSIAPRRLRAAVALPTVLLLLAGAGVGALEAQDRGSLVGSVADEVTGEPLPGAVVSVAGDDDARTEADAEGQFVLPDLPVGDVSIRAEHPGYSAVVEQVEVSANDVVFLRVQLPRVEAVLDELLVRGERERPLSQRLGDVRVRDDDSRTAADLLAQEVPGVHVTWGSGSVGSGATIQIRGISSFVGPHAPVVLLDGIRIDDRGGSTAPGARSQQALHTLETIPAGAVANIRVMKGASAAAQYADAANGVIQVETRSGGEEE